MNKVLIVIGGVFAAVAAFFFIPLLGTLMGAFSGWVVGLFFPETILGFFAQLGISGLAVWQIGAALGFVGGFFKSVQTNNNK